MSDPQNSYQIPNSRYVFYNETFADTAISGINSSQKIFEAIDVISRVNFSSIPQRVDVANSVNILINAITFSYELLFSEAHSIHPMRDAFDDLASHIIKWTGKTLDQYLTDEGIKVNRTYANISNIASSRLRASATISESNIS